MQMRIDDISFSCEDFRYRTPIKFGGVALDRVTVLNVQVYVSNPDGKRASGFGSMPLGNVWSFPSRLLGYEGTLTAMKGLVERVGRIVGACTEVGHPIDLAWTLEPAFLKAAAEVTAELKL